MPTAHAGPAPSGPGSSAASAAGSRPPEDPGRAGCRVASGARPHLSPPPNTRHPRTAQSGQLPAAHHLRRAVLGVVYACGASSPRGHPLALRVGRGAARTTLSGLLPDLDSDRRRAEGFHRHPRRARGGRRLARAGPGRPAPRLRAAPLGGRLAYVSWYVTACGGSRSRLAGAPGDQPQPPHLRRLGGRGLTCTTPPTGTFSAW